MSRRTRAMVTLVLILAVAAAGFCGWQWKQSEDTERARSEVLTVAREYAVTIASYDYEHLDEYFDAARRITTGPLAQHYEDADGDLREAITSAQAVVRATVVRAAVESSSDDRAVVLLFVDQQVRSAVAQQEAVDRNRVRLSLERRGGQWLVSQLELE